MEKQVQVRINREHVANEFYDDRLPAALRKAEAFAKETGSFVKSMPEVLALRRNASFSNPIWHEWYACNSEEDVVRTPQGKRVMIEIHGGGVLTPELIETAYETGLTKQYAAPLAEDEARKLLEGKIADGTQIPYYPFSEFKRGIKDLPRRYAVIMDFAMAKAAAWGHVSVETLREDPLVIVRAGGVAAAHALADKVAQRYRAYGNHHPFKSINPDEAQVRPLFVDHYEYIGLFGYDGLTDSGRYLVDVVPEARIGTEYRVQKLETLLQVGREGIVHPLGDILGVLKQGVDRILRKYL